MAFRTQDVERCTRTCLSHGRLATVRLLMHSAAMFVCEPGEDASCSPEQLTAAKRLQAGLAALFPSFSYWLCNDSLVVLFRANLRPWLVLSDLQGCVCVVGSVF